MGNFCTGASKATGYDFSVYVLVHKLCWGGIGKRGWLPAALLQHFVHLAAAPFAGRAGYLKVDVGDRLAIFRRVC